MKSKDKQPLFIRWTEHVPASDVQDPLGLALRGSTRIANQLLFCITTITPRARYFSFIPWSVYDWQSREKHLPHALGLAEGISLRERALTLACVAHHEGRACDGGALVGSRKAIAWFKKGNREVNLLRQQFAQVPALGAYFNSLVNLGLFVVEDEVANLSAEDEGESEFTFDDIELSSIGLRIARAYDSSVGRLRAVREISSHRRRCSVQSLERLGERGGLCELSLPTAPELNILRDVFFDDASSLGGSHLFRRNSLMLLLEICGQLSKGGWTFDEPTYSSVVYYGGVISEQGARLSFECPAPLRDVMIRWRMFYFHHYMAVALEAMFSWLVSNSAQEGLRGLSLDELCGRLDGSDVRKEMSAILGSNIRNSFGKMTPRELLKRFVHFKRLDVDSSKELDRAIRPDAYISEMCLERVIRSAEYQHTGVGLAVPMTLLTLTLARYQQWISTPYGDWLANITDDPYLDLTPPVLVSGLERRFNQWVSQCMRDIAEFVVHRYVVQHHLAMSYEKTQIGDRCLLQVDGESILATGLYDKIGMGNPRFASASQILRDLGLLVDGGNGCMQLSEDGRSLLRDKLSAELNR